MPKDLLALLADGEIHSGQKLGEALSISRAAINKKMTKLSELGIAVERIKGSGYRLSAPLDLLCGDRVFAQLNDSVRMSVPDLDVSWSTPSTNTRCLEFIKTDPARSYVCIAEFQSEGRGRRGRQWHSALGAGLYMSVAWPFNGCAGELEGLSLAVAAVVAKVLELTFGVKEVSLKWPNDILVGDKKLGGILVEIIGESAGPCSVVVGIGINTNAPEQYAFQIDQPFTDIKSVSKTVQVSRNSLCAELLNEIVPLLASYEHAGFSSYRNDWQKYDAFLGKRVVVHSGANTYCDGIASGINAAGDLILNDSGVMRTFRSGEVSLRRE